MTNQIRLLWEPVNSVPYWLIESTISKYTNQKHSFLILKNGTLLFFKDFTDYDEKVSKTMQAAQMMTDFSVDIMSGGDYVVHFRGPIDVYVGKEEFETLQATIEQRRSELMFPGEAFISPPEGMEKTRLLVGLYARAKMYRDAYDSQVIKFVQKPS